MYACLIYVPANVEDMRLPLKTDWPWAKHMHMIIFVLNFSNLV